MKAPLTAACTVWCFRLFLAQGADSEARNNKNESPIAVSKRLKENQRVPGTVVPHIGSSLSDEQAPPPHYAGSNLLLQQLKGQRPPLNTICQGCFLPPPLLPAEQWPCYSAIWAQADSCQIQGFGRDNEQHWTHFHLMILTSNLSTSMPRWQQKNGLKNQQWTWMTNRRWTQKDVEKWIFGTRASCSQPPGSVSATLVTHAPCRVQCWPSASHTRSFFTVLCMIKVEMPLSWNFQISGNVQLPNSSLCDHSISRFCV